LLLRAAFSPRGALEGGISEPYFGEKMSRQLRWVHAEVLDDEFSAHFRSGAVGSGKTCRSVHAPIL
jgi:hypothetical protein